MSGPARLRLAPVAPEHGPQLFAWINDADLVRLHGDYRPVSPEAHAAWMASLGSDASKCVRAILADEALIGLVQLTGIDLAHRTAELTIRIAAADHRGAGLGTEAVTLMLRHGFDALGLHRIYLHVRPTNLAAIRAYEKAGMRQEGVLREATRANNELSDLIIMSRLATD